MYDSLILSALNNWYLDVKQRRPFGSTIGIVAATERKATSQWAFEETSCFFGEDFLYHNAKATSRCSQRTNEGIAVNEIVLKPKSGQFLYSIINVANGKALTAVDGEVWIKEHEDSECQRWFKHDSRIVACNGKVLELTDIDEPIALTYYNAEETKQQWKFVEADDERDEVLIISLHNDLRLDPIGTPYWKPNGVRIGAYTALDGADIDVQSWHINFATVVDADDE